MAIRAAKRRRLSPPEEESKPTAKPDTSHKKVSDKAFEPGVFSKVNGAAEWDEEQDYESRPRKIKTKTDGAKLPIKTADGWVAQPVSAPAAADEDSEDSFLNSGDEDEDAEEQKGAAEEEEPQPEEPQIPLRQRINEAKEELARLAGHVNEDPETNIGALKSIETLANSPHAAVKKLALATQLAVYKDIIPGYRLRPIASEEVSSTKVSKDVRKLRAFEQSLLSGYQKYLKSLGACARSSGSKDKDESSLASVAISCACNLVNSVSHFNFRDVLLGILIKKLGGNKVDGDFQKCIECLETLFRNDEDGNASRDAVQQLNSLAKTKHYAFDESILNTFLHLRLLSELGVKGSHEKIDNPEEDQKKGKTRWKKEWRSKKEKKMARENKAIEKEFREADAAVSHEERDKNQAETLKIVFVTYFQILKKRNPKLMGAVLEGLAKYSHLINQDFFGDILEVLKELITQAEAQSSEPNDPEDEEELSAREQQRTTRSALLCCVTAFALLQGQDAAYATSTLHLDLSFFINHLYRTLLPVSLNPDIELNSKSLHLPDPHSHTSNPENGKPRTKVNVQTTTVLLIRSLTSTLLPQHSARSIPASRIAAFAKQILLASLHLPEKSATAMLGLMTMIVKQHGTKISGLWNSEERRGDGVWDGTGAGSGGPEGSNPFASSVWEGEVLKWHFCPGVRGGWDGVMSEVRKAERK